MFGAESQLGSGSGALAAFRIAAAFLLLCAGSAALLAGDETGRRRADRTDPTDRADLDRDALLVPFWQEILDPPRIPRFPEPRRVSDPFRSGHNQFLHHLVLIPPLEGFRVIEKNRFAFDLGLEALRETRCGENGTNRWDASWFEAATRISYGLTRIFELRAGFNVAYFRPDNPDAVALTQEGETVLPAGHLEDLEPGIGNVTLGVKIFSAYTRRDHLGLSTLLTLKIPVGGDQFLSSGRGDFSCLFAGTGRLDLGDGVYLYGHANIGACWFDEENVFPRKVYLDPVAVYGGALVLPLPVDKTFLKIPLAFSAWIQGHGNAFRKLDVLNSDPLSAHAGVRAMFGSWAVEGSAGIGLTETGAPDVVVNLSLGSDF